MLGTRIRTERRNRNKTQEELAQHLGVKRSVISKYETGLITPSLAQLLKIAEFLDVPCSTLIGDGTFTTIDISSSPWLPSQEEFTRMPTAEKEYYSVRLQAEISPDILFRLLIEAYEQLNRFGKVAAVVRLKELTECAKYTEPDSNDSQISIPIHITSQDKKETPQD